MKIFYSPTYNGFTYLDLSEPLFDAKVVNTLGLVDAIELCAGIHFERLASEKRLIDYYLAMKKHFAACKDSVLQKSFELDPINTARECLAWRDSLAAMGWKKEDAAPSQRMKALGQIENFFAAPSFAEETLFVTQKIDEGCPLPGGKDGLTITVPFDWHCFAPVEVKLLEALEKSGAKIEVSAKSKGAASDLEKVRGLLSEPAGQASGANKSLELLNDGSFEILHFESQSQAEQYFSLLPENSADVWIDSESKIFDNYLKLQGKPLCGSQIEAGLLQSGQLLSIGLRTFLRPLNLSNIVEWLNVPISPLDYSLRKRLSETIIRSGAYYNDDCRKILSECSDEKVKAQIKDFLPDINDCADGAKIEVSKIVLFAKNLKSWLGTRIAVFDDDGMKAVLARVRLECDSLALILESYDEKEIDSSQLEILISSINQRQSVVQYEAQKGCRCVIDGPGLMAACAKKTIWLDFYKACDASLSTAFLFAAEKECVSKSPLWHDEALEREFIKNASLLPFVNTMEKLSLVVVDKIRGQELAKNPLYIRLCKQIKNLDAVTKNPAPDKKYFCAPEKIDNGMPAGDECVRIKRADLIKFPEKQSPTSLDELIYNPFDYVFGLAGIEGKGIGSASPVWTTEGTVAHAVVERIVGHGEKDFDAVFDSCVASRGAILLQDENKMECSIFKARLSDCVKGLEDVIKENGLSIVECEKKLFSDDMNFCEPLTIKGFADCILSDKNSNLIVWDYKWSGNRKRYKKLLEENRSLQTALYKELVFKMERKKAVSAAYVLLPELLIVSTEAYKGNCLQVTVSDESRQVDLLQEIRNSYEYRKKQIESGVIEEGEGMEPESLTYARDTEEKHLLPLKFDDDGLKEENAYSDYSLFKGKKQ